jgi:hypothetical protein
MPTRHYRTFRFLLLASVAALGAARAEQTFASQASAATVAGWRHSGDCRFELAAGVCTLVSTGIDPYIDTHDLPHEPGAKNALHVDVSMKSNSGGIGQIYYAGAGDGGAYSPHRFVNFGILHDSQWHRYTVYLPVTELTGLRLDPSMAPGRIELASIRLADHTGRVLKQWDFGRGGAEQDYPNAAGNAQIYGTFKGSPLVVTTTARLAGAIHSLTWNGREFIDSVDHGRQLQSATNLDCGTAMKAETYNPTEAGSRDDAGGVFSTSRLLSLTAQGPELKTVTQMAFWLPPGGTSGGQPAKNTTTLSNHTVEKRVHIGHGEMANVIEYDVKFPLPTGERQTATTMEALTGYMPYDFRSFRTFDPATGQIARVEAKNREQAQPLIFASPDDQFAMGIIAPERQPGGVQKAGYGIFKFDGEKVVKWNCVYRDHDPAGLKKDFYAFRMFVVVGTLEDVRASMVKLAAESGAK